MAWLSEFFAGLFGLEAPGGTQDDSEEDELPELPEELADAIWDIPQRYGQTYQAADSLDKALRLMDPELIMDTAIENTKAVCLLLIDEWDIPASKLMNYLKPLAEAVEEYAPLYGQFCAEYAGMWEELPAKARRWGAAGAQLGRAFGMWGEVAGALGAAWLAGGNSGEQMEAAFRQLESAFIDVGCQWDECSEQIHERCARLLARNASR